MYLPATHDGTSRLPAVYVLDGAIHGEPVAGMAEALSLEVAVIAVGYDDGFSPDRRLRDYSPTIDDSYASSGGADAFYEFLSSELIPRIEAEFPIDDLDRTLLGHSQGGLAALYFAMKPSEEALFTKFGAASPALWWDGGVMLDLETDFGATNSSWPIQIYTSVGELEPVPLWGYFHEFTARVHERDYQQLDLTTREHERTSHDAAWITAYPEALEYLHASP